MLVANLSEFIPKDHWFVHNMRRLLDWEYFPLAILIGANVFIGLATNHYGMGWDDFTFSYGEDSLSSYRTLLLDHSSHYYCSFSSSAFCYYGPAYFMLVTMIVKLVLNLNFTLLIPDIWHAVNFIVFNIGIISLYVLSRLWLTRWSSISIALLFAVQPLLRGHGFINPKDLPFMVFFLASITTGLVMVESFARIFTDQSKWNVNYRQLLGDVWRALGLIESRKKRIYLSWSAALVASIVLVLVFLPVVNSFVVSIVEFLYGASPSNWLGVFFNHIAPNASNIPLTSYIEKSTKIMARGIAFYVLLVTALTLGILIYWGRAPLSALLSVFVNQTVRVLRSRQMWFAGLILGFASAIRVLGPYAAVIVLTYMVFRLRLKALPLVLPYLTISFLFMYIFWPFLWKSPVINLFKSMVYMSAYPWPQDVLFNGVFYQAKNLPAAYLPALITIQITESVIFLFFLGLIYLLLKLKQQDYLRLFLVFSIWFVVPVAGVVIFRPTLYDNFRQFLFIIPPLFLVASLGLELIFRYLQNKTLRILLLSMLVIPAIYVNVQLYPFEYVYYNSFVGGTNGAFRKFEMDYWETSYREVAEYLNSAEKEGAQLVSFPAAMSAFANRDFSLYDGTCTRQPLYAVISSRWNGDKTEYETAPIVQTIKRGDAVLMVIRKLPCPPTPP
jgi:hypothetical protein